MRGQSSSRQCNVEFGIRVGRRHQGFHEQVGLVTQHLLMLSWGPSLRPSKASCRPSDCSPRTLRTRSGHGLRPPQGVVSPTPRQPTERTQRQRGDTSVACPSAGLLSPAARCQGRRKTGSPENPAVFRFLRAVNPASPTPTGRSAVSFPGLVQIGKRINERDIARRCISHQAVTGEFFILIFAVQNETWR